MKIGFKITLIGITGVIATLVCFIIGFTNMGRLQTMFDFCGDVAVKNLVAASNISTSLQKVTAQNALYFYHKDNPAEIQKITDTVNSLGKVLTENLTFLDTNVSEAGKKYIEKFGALAGQIKAARLKVTQLAHEGKWEEFQKYRPGEYKELVDSSLQVMQDYVTFASDKALHYALVESQEIVDQSTTLQLTISAITLVLLIVILIVVVKGITTPLKKAVYAAEQISIGNFNVELETTSKDETGMLMQSMTGMIESINHMSHSVD